MTRIELLLSHLHRYSGSKFDWKMLFSLPFPFFFFFDQSQKKNLLWLMFFVRCSSLKYTLLLLLPLQKRKQQWMNTILAIPTSLNCLRSTISWLRDRVCRLDASLFDEVQFTDQSLWLAEMLLKQKKKECYERNVTETIQTENKKTKQNKGLEDRMTKCNTVVEEKKYFSFFFGQVERIEADSD